MHMVEMEYFHSVGRPRSRFGVKWWSKWGQTGAIVFKTACRAENNLFCAVSIGDYGKHSVEVRGILAQGTLP